VRCSQVADVRGLEVRNPFRSSHVEEGKPVNKNDLVAVVADKTDLPKAKTAEVIDAVLDAITAALKKKDGEVRLVGFGTFSKSKRKAGIGRNPRTGEQIKIASSVSVRFKAGKALKDAIN